MADGSGTNSLGAAEHAPINLSTTERVVSVGLGTALLLRVLGGTVIGPALLGVGAVALIWRGVSGVCPAKAALMGDTDRIGGTGAARRRSGRSRRAGADAEGDPVHVASEDSFPASDPPAWTPTSGSTRRH